MPEVSLGLAEDAIATEASHICLLTRSKSVYVMASRTPRRHAGQPLESEQNGMSGSSLPRENHRETSPDILWLSKKLSSH
jgi:hypothetical protein